MAPATTKPTTASSDLNSHETLGLAGLCSLVFAAVRWSGDRKRTAAGAKRDRKRTAASCERMRDNHRYGGESRD
jgi:hypothetical protein